MRFVEKVSTLVPRRLLSQRARPTRFALNVRQVRHSCLGPCVEAVDSDLRDTRGNTGRNATELPAETVALVASVPSVCLGHG